MPLYRPALPKNEAEVPEIAGPYRFDGENMASLPNISADAQKLSSVDDVVNNTVALWHEYRARN